MFRQILKTQTKTNAISKSYGFEVLCLTLHKTGFDRHQWHADADLTTYYLEIMYRTGKTTVVDLSRIYSIGLTQSYMFTDPPTQHCMFDTLVITPEVAYRGGYRYTITYRYSKTFQLIIHTF